MSQEKSFQLNKDIEWMREQEGFAVLTFSIKSGEYQHSFA